MEKTSNSVVKVSVIIPTYKPQLYLWDCLSSIVKQTFNKDFYEVIVVLNGVIEPFENQINKYIKEYASDCNIRLLTTKIAGVSYARNLGLDSAKGEYVTFIDDDDYVSSVYLEELYSKSSSDTIALCYPYAFKDGYTVQLPYRITEQYDKLAFLGKQTYLRARKYFSGPCMKLIPMNYIQGRRFNPNFKNGEDSLFMFLISDKFKWVDFTSKEAVYFRRVRNNSASVKITCLGRIKNSLMLIREYIAIYIFDVRHYSIYFFCTRILGLLKSLCVNKNV